jgi:hypothetical protein
LEIPLKDENEVSSQNKTKVMILIGI